MTLTYIPDEAIQAIAVIGAARAPREACGILVAPCLIHNPPCSSVIELENQAVRSPQAGIGCYGVSGDQISDALVSYYRNHLELLPREVKDGYFLWHTHMPEGTEGPSVGDMRHRISDVRYLVVRLPIPGTADRGRAVRY